MKKEYKVFLSRADLENDLDDFIDDVFDFDDIDDAMEFFFECLINEKNNEFITQNKVKLKNLFESTFCILFEDDYMYMI